MSNLKKLAVLILVFVEDSFRSKDYLQMVEDIES